MAGYDYNIGYFSQQVETPYDRIKKVIKWGLLALALFFVIQFIKAIPEENYYDELPTVQLQQSADNTFNEEIIVSEAIVANEEIIVIPDNGTLALKANESLSPASSTVTSKVEQVAQMETETVVNADLVSIDITDNTQDNFDMSDVSHNENNIVFDKDLAQLLNRLLDK